MMKVFRNNELMLEQSVVTIGAFDGIHRGHQALIERAVNRARELAVPSVVYTFNPPPRAFFQNQMVLTNVGEKISFIKKMKVDYVIIADFNEHYASRSPEAFLQELKVLNPQEVWVGPDFNFGKGKKGTAADLSAMFQTFTHPPIKCSKGETISSTRIRNLLCNQEAQLANELLGRNLFKKIL
jgi:riboflavin kinase / FMN adenylyltransferase